MKWKNIQFGELEFEEKHVLNFPYGLIGFEENRKFLVVNDEESEPFRWLVSLDDPELSFPMIDVSTYSEISNKYFPKENVTLFAVASIKEHFDESTVNMRSPIVIDNADRKGKQIVLDDDVLMVRTPLTSFTPVLME
ncbi:MAG: flagellar assembly protein FliW [Bacteroidota bacterium]|jgi:flagellar assembly factor FliW